MKRCKDCRRWRLWFRLTCRCGEVGTLPIGPLRRLRGWLSGTDIQELTGHLIDNMLSELEDTSDWPWPERGREEEGSVTKPVGLYYSERKLWDECPEARPVLERLARIRLITREGESATVVAALPEREGWFRRLLRRLVGPLNGDPVPCPVCGNAEEGHDQCGEGMQLHYEWRN